MRIRRGVFPSDALVTGLAALDTGIDALSAGLRGSKTLQRRVSSEFDVIVSGYPRSGNSFLAQALSEACDGQLRVGSREHSPLVPYLAGKVSVPTVIPIREPVVTIASWMIFKGVSPERSEIHRYLRSYTRWYEFVSKYRNSQVSLIADFANFTVDVNPVLSCQMIVETCPSEPQTVENSRVLAALKSAEKTERGTGFTPMASVPVEGRQADKEEMRDRIMSGARESVLRDAQKAFDQLAQHRQ